MAPRWEVGFLTPHGFAGSLRARSLALPQIKGLLAPNDPSSMEKAWSLALWCVLVCYNTGYRVGKLPGLPSRQKGIMSMARYHYTRENEKRRGTLSGIGTGGRCDGRVRR